MQATDETVRPPVSDHVWFSQAAKDVTAERRRQIEQEGYDYTHDDDHAAEMTMAACALALYSDAYPNCGQPPELWPWTPESWKPKDYRRDLVRAAALLIAEIERIDRKSI